MSVIGSIALSGLQAAAKRLAVSADNVVNLHTSRPVDSPDAPAPEEVYRPQRIEQIPLEDGGVRAVRRPVEPSTLVLVDPSSPTGLAAFPNVDLESEIVDQRIAATTYKASLAVLRTDKELEDALLDIKS